MPDGTHCAPAEADRITLAHAAVIRCLWPFEFDQFQQHLQRLDGVSRIDRFGRGVSDEWLIGYSAETDWLRGAVLGCWVEGRLRGVAELRRCGPGWSPAAEAAVSIEAPFQNKRLGSVLAGRVGLIARNRGIRRLEITTLAMNVRMLRILSKLGAKLRRISDQIEAEIALAPPHGLTLAEEWVEQGWAMVQALRAPPFSASADSGRRGWAGRRS